MIEAAIRRNQKHIETGKAESRIADVLRFDPGARRFDKIFAIRVGLFHRESQLDVVSSRSGLRLEDRSPLSTMSHELVVSGECRIRISAW